ncbi:MAG TPA: hypothetical protein VGP25_10760 [Gemmatimonadaceae bacterium]|nr:hypothetical protein [Gemmatimonadaceae bacterium]
MLDRLRAFASEPPEHAAELNEATRCVQSVCPDFAFSGTGIARRATFTLRDGTPKEVTGRTHGDLLSKAAGVITGKKAERIDRRRGRLL